VGLYSGSRSIVFGQACSAPLEAGGTILAGCSCATTLAKVLLLRLLVAVTKAFPSAEAKNVVDDISLQSLGPQRFVASVLGKAGNMLARGLEDDLRLPISANKTAFVASSDDLARALEATWSARGFKRKQHARNLGVDATAGRTRATPISTQRLASAAKRSGRLQILKKAGAKTLGLQRAGATAAALWGAAATGIPPGPLHRLRVAALRAKGNLAKGSSVGLKMGTDKACQRTDPAALHHQQVVLRWTTAVWDGYPALHILEKTL